MAPREPDTDRAGSTPARGVEDQNESPHAFDAALARTGRYPLLAEGISVLQINLGRRCNLSCVHCHVEAGPGRAETMSRPTMEACLGILQSAVIPTVDLTGGAPETHPDFRWFVRECRRLGVHVLVRTNLVIMQEPGYEDIPRFLKDQAVEIVASLPCYTAENVDAQRGPGVYDRSIRALQALNQQGFGQPDADLILHLVYNPGGASLPGPQESLEADYRRELSARHGIVFNRLFTLTNMPIGRFRRYLDSRGIYDEYMDLLSSRHNPAAVDAVMCRSLLSVGPDGAIYDCDFNQMLDLRCNHGAPDRLEIFDPEALRTRRIVTGPHCFGCTAGAGSSCRGALA